MCKTPLIYIPGFIYAANPFEKEDIAKGGTPSHRTKGNQQKGNK